MSNNNNEERWCAMVSVNRIFNGSGGSDEGKKPGPWDQTNVDDYRSWIADNKDKIESGRDALGKVMSIGSDVAGAAAVKWFHQTGWEADEVLAISARLAERIVEACDSRRSAVIEDCAKMFAGSGSTTNVMIMAFVAYAVIGIEVAMTFSRPGGES